MVDLTRQFALGVVACLVLACHPALGQTFPDPVPVSAWGFLQAEAVDVLERQGFPAALTPKFARSKIRAYVFARLLEIVGKPAADRSEDEKAAYNALKSAVQANRAAIAGNALRYWESIEAGDSCFSGGNPASGIYVPPLAIVSLFCELFQTQKPNQREVYRGQGATETYAQLLTGNGLVEMTAVLDDMDWFAGRAVTADGPLFQADSQAEKDYQAALNVFRNIRGKEQNAFLLSLINPELAPEAVIRGLLVLGTAVWDIADFAVIGNDLRAAANSAATDDPNLEAAVDGQLTELALVFMGKVLVPAAGQTDRSPSTRPCQFNAAYTCAYWAIRVADPDYVAERYAAAALPSPPPGGYFALKKEGAGAWQKSADLSPSIIDGSGIGPWALPLKSDPNNLNGELGGSSTRLQDPLPPGVTNPNDLRLPKTSGLSTFVADGFLVHAPTNAPEQWKYGTTLKYKNWKGEWWEARLVNGTFLHVRNGVELSGFAQVGGFVQEDGGLIIQDGTYTDGYTYCKAWKRGSGGYHADPYRDAGKVDGQCILLAKDFDASQLAVGDRIEIGGQQRTITSKVNCEGEKLDNSGPLIDLFVGQLRCDEADGGGYAVDPATSNWNRTALIVTPALASLVGDYGPSDWLAVRKLEDVDTCARATTGIASFRCGPVFDPNGHDRHDFAYCPVFGAAIVGDTSLRSDPLPEYIFDDSVWENEFAPLDCFYSPMLRYQSSASENWSALYVPPANAADDAYTVVGPSLVVPYSNGVVMNDNLPSSASITDKSGYRVTLTRDAAHGSLVLNDDGSFGYTRGLATAGDPWCGPPGSPYCGPDSFEYEVCADRDGGTDCDRAEVSLTVKNEPPRAFDVSFAPAGGKYVASYTYWDPEGDPEQGTSFAWTWQDASLQKHVTTTGTDELLPDPSLQSVVKVEVTPMAGRGSWPDAPQAYGSDESWALEYGIGFDCTPDFLAFPDGQTQCVFSPWVNRPYPVAMPYQLFLGTLSAAWEFAPDNCQFATIVGYDAIGTQTCTATLKLRTGFSDSGNIIRATASIWINGVFDTGDRVYTKGKSFARSAPAAALPVTVSVNSASGGSAACAPNPVPTGGSATCTASPAAGWKFAGWTQDCTALGPICTLHEVTATRNVTANFLPTVSTGTTASGTGSVACAPNPVALGGTTTCTATPGAGYAFAAWSGDCTGLDAQCQLAGVIDAKAVTANFVETFPSGDGTKAAVPWVQVAGGNGWAFTSGVDPSLPTLGWIPPTGSPNSPPVPPPPGVNLIYGLLDFVLESGTPGSTAQVTITYPDPLPAGTQYWKFNRTTQAWYALDPARYTVSGNTITLSLTDGQSGDNDGAANGYIVDPGGPALREAEPAPLPVRQIPTLQGWAALLLAAMLALMGARRFGRRARAPREPGPLTR